MTAFQNISIKFKLPLLFLLFTAFMLSVAGAVLLIFDLRLVRQELVRNLSALAEIVGDNSTAALSFDSKENGQTILASLRNEPKIVAARLYQRDAAGSFKEFVSYVRAGSSSEIPPQPKSDGYMLEPNRLIVFRSIKQDASDKIIGSLYLESDLQAVQQRLKIYAAELTAILVLSSLFGIVLVLYLNRSISGPLRQITSSASQIASGSLAVQLPEADREDEVGQLSQAFRRMTEGLSQQSRDLVEGTNVLASSSNAILAASTQVVAVAAETGAAIAETTTTVEEVKQTALVSSQKAKSVSESAQRAVQVAQAGRKSVEAALEGMNRIQAQMESIAESVVKLSEQGQAIGEIIATVNDLAEQSNLLAVNAAIEAAKAGDQGKGFAVVAQEVKSLAEQSKQATTQVRAILSDIQKATTAAVLATEQGSKAVDAGARQSAEAGEAIRSLADSITEAAQAATQIAASSQQQLAGTDQVGQAMESIKQASAQNAAGAKQTETAAHNLQELGQKLKQLVEQYRV